MNTTSEPSPERDPVEALLQQAAPRQVPPADIQREVHDAVAAEWQEVTRRAQTRRRAMQFGLAASFVVAAGLAFNLLNVSAPDLKTVASVDRIHGPVYRLGADAEPRGLVAGEELLEGQIIVTQNEAGLGVHWSGGRSLRVDQNTRVEFVAADEVFLHSGLVYFDSMPLDPEITTNVAGLTVTTPHGAVTHVGTQFMAEVDGETLRVSVREGKVRVLGRMFDEAAGRGQQLEIASGGRPVKTNISPHSAAWQWAEAIAPRINVDGMSTWDFLQWVGRETGNRIVFETAEAERIAKRGRLKGSVNADPRTELRIRMLGEDLAYTVAAGVITVTVNK